MLRIDCAGSHIIVSGVKDFDLAATLTCGQCFRWAFVDGAWQGVANGRFVRIKQEEKTLIFEDAPLEQVEKIWLPYFDLHRDYGAICDTLSQQHKPLADIIKKHNNGIRILQQEPWEALCSFIVSQNNNIPRITKCIDRLCTEFGAAGAFPTPQTLAGADLSQCGLGYRAGYINDAAKKICDNLLNLEELRTIPLPQAREKLLQIKGVGPKVAECALLFGLHRLDAFPQDVWIIRGMAKYFPGQTHEIFGEYAGVAQQYLYVLTREKA